MRSNRVVRPPWSRKLTIGFLFTCPIFSLSGLLALSAMSAQSPKKTQPFPLNLFSQAKAEDYVDEAACTGCHETAHANFQLSPHKAYSGDAKLGNGMHGCQSCHGPGTPHIEHLEKEDERYQFVISYARATPMQASAACMRCHNDTMTMAHFRRTGHGRANVGCVSCHAIHQDPHGRLSRKAPFDKPVKGSTFGRSSVLNIAPPPRKLLKADEPTLCGQCHQPEINEFRHNFHHPVPEGRLVCSDCHEIHPRRAAEKQTAAHTRLRPAKEMCVTCHAETAGPFVFEHDPVVGLTGDGCMECHRPHGSQNSKMLSTFSRGACANCHTDKSNNHFPGRSCWQAGCHVAVHGSNSDPLFLRR